MKSLAILCHAEDRFWDANFLVRGLIPRWEQMGIRVDVLHGIGTETQAEAILLHVDLTIIPEPYLEFARRYPLVVNGSATDISKKLVSRDILSRDSKFQGPVIVKTNLNSGGGPERRLFSLRNRVLGRFTEAASRRLPWTWTGRVNPSKYPILESVGSVPGAVWINRKLVVERFLPEREDDLFCLRQWVFLGDRDMHIRSFSNSPIVKAGTIDRYEELGEVPEGLRAMRERLGFDFGKFDYGIVDDRVVLYDANRTPTVAPPEGRTANTARIENLAEGILSVRRT